MTVPDVADWAGSAAFIDTGRTLDSQTNLNTVSYSSPTIDVSRFQSIGINLGWSGAASPASSYVTLSWQEDGVAVWEDAFTLWNGNALAATDTFNLLQVPCIGSTLQLNTPQPAAGDKLFLRTVGSSRRLEKVRAACYGPNSYAGRTFGNNNAIAAGATDTWYGGPQPGPTSLFFVTNGPSMTLSVLPIAFGSSGGLSNRQLVSVTATGATNVQEFVLPAAAFTVTVKNNSGGAGIYTFAMMSES